MNNDIAESMQQVLHITYTTRRSANTNSTSSTSGMIGGIVVGSICGLILLAVIVFVIVQCCKQGQPVAQPPEQVQVTYPPPNQNYNYDNPNGYNGGTQPNGAPMPYYGNNGGGGGGAGVPPPFAPQPAITPLGMDGTENPFSPNGGNYAYTPPLGVPPPQFPGDNGTGMYYSRQAEAHAAGGTPSLQRSNSMPSTKNGSPVTIFRN